MSDRKPKFAVGDTVTVGDKFGLVIEVHEENYWFGAVPDATYYEYSVKFDNGDVHKYGEPVLDKSSRGVRLCECGAWATAWSANQHSRWCPAYKSNDWRPNEF